MSDGEVFRMGFWGVCGALAVVAVAMVQKAPEVRAATERQLATEIAQENSAYCEKWGMQAGTRQHVICTLDLDEMRARQAKRLALQKCRDFGGENAKIAVCVYSGD